MALLCTLEEIGDRTWLCVMLARSNGGEPDRIYEYVGWDECATSCPSSGVLPRR